MKITVLDGYVINPGDLSWQELEELGQLTVYERTNPEDILSRISGNYAIFTNKCRITAEIMDKSPDLNRRMQRSGIFIGKRSSAYLRTHTGALQLCRTP